jgi:hypothetical protein
MSRYTPNKNIFRYLSKQSVTCLIAVAVVGLLCSRDTFAAPSPQANAIVSIRVADPAAAEAGEDPAMLSVVRNGNKANALKIFYSIIGTATPGNDYVTLPGNLTIPAGASSATLSIEPVDDAAKEDAETIIISLDIAPDYAIAAPTSATFGIADDDAPGQAVSFYVDDSSAAEPGTDTGEFTIARNGSTAKPLTIFYAIGGTATPGVDYEALTGSVTIPAGSATSTLNVTLIDDALVEATELVVASFIADTSYNISTPASATVAIGDNDNVPADAMHYHVFLPSLRTNT